VIGADGFCLRGPFSSSPTVVMTVQPMAFAIMIASRADSGAAGLHQDRFAAFELGVCQTACARTVENPIGAQAASRIFTPFGTGIVRRAGKVQPGRAQIHPHGSP